MSKYIIEALSIFGILTIMQFFLSAEAFASGVEISGLVEKQPLNMTAVIMFLIFVLATLGITWWAARNTKTKDDFYAAGGGIKPWQNGTAIAGDFMSAATFLGLTGAIYGFGYDALILAIGVMVAWPFILFLVAERLRNLGSYTFIDVVSYRLEKKPIRIISAIGSLSVIIFYLIDFIAELEYTGLIFTLLFLLYLYKALRNFYNQVRIKTIIKYIIMNIFYMFLGMLGLIIVALISFMIT